MDIQRRVVFYLPPLLLLLIIFSCNSNVICGDKGTHATPIALVRRFQGWRVHKHGVMTSPSFNALELDSRLNDISHRKLRGSPPASYPPLSGNNAIIFTPPPPS